MIDLTTEIVEKSNSIRFVTPHKRRAAAAALELLQAIEAGTAIERQPPAAR